MSQPQPQDGAPLKRVESFQWPAGHVGHLTDGQRGALEKFKKLSQEKGYYVPGDSKAPPTHDDETLLRYLRARKFVPSEAFNQFKSTEDWRAENQLDKLYETIDVEEYEQTRRLYPQWTGRRDKRGVPVYVFQVNDVTSKALNAYETSKDAKKSKSSIESKTPRKMLRLFALYENLCRFVLPLCSAIPDRPHGETPMSQSSNIVDISGVGFAKFWSLRNHMSDASRLATAYYPETLDRIFVVGAPSFFPTIWSWAQKWFDPITVSKIFILSNKEMASTFAKYIDPDNLPRKYGGNLEWSFGDMPLVEAGIANNMRWKEDVRLRDQRTLPIGPIKWQYDSDGDLVAIAVGSENGVPRNKVIAGLHPETNVAGLALSPGRTDKSSLFVNMSGAALSKSPASREVEAQVNGHSTAAMNSTTAPATDANVASTTLEDAKDVDQPKNDPHVPTSSRAGTATTPSRDSNVVPPSRQGTSETRFEQQAGTHADGQVAHATPEVRVDGQGEKSAIMEPSTIGQAPKEHPVPDLEEPQPGILEQAQNLAASAYQQTTHLPQTLISAIGLGGNKEEPPSQSASKDDPAVDNLGNPIVEDFLRSKTVSTARPVEGK